MSKPEILSESEDARADDELTASLTRIEHAVDRVVEQRDRYAGALRDILEMAEDHDPLPDAWMQVATLARTALEGK